MSIAETESGALEGNGARLKGQSLILGVFALTLFASALLLFSVQPLFTKMVLPRLGGSPSVWSVAMVFFQGVLLAGYGYAHMLTRYTKPRTALLIHACVLLVAFVALPINISSGWGRPPETGQASWLIGLFLASVGLPFFAVSANGPLLQAWFSRTGHPHADDPYFLYGASNVGSFAALISYPVFFEPVFSLGTQAFMWSAGFAVLALLIIASGMIAARSGVVKAAVTATSGLIDSVPGFNRRLTWIALAFVPSGLLVAVTQHISTDIAAAPFLWVIPLALYLLTFVITFQRNPVLKHSWMTFLLPLLAGPLVVSLFFDLSGLLSAIVMIVLHFSAFFVAAMVCHGELVRRRPSATYLTEFYLWMSFGGVLGGIFTSLIAPVIFSTVVEYPILIVATFLCRSEFYQKFAGSWQRNSLFLLLVTGLLLVPGMLGFSFEPQTEIYYRIGLTVFAALIMLSREAPVRHFGLVVMVLIVGSFYESSLGQIEFHRSFFGVNKVAVSRDGQYRLLFHGTTLHGAERIRNADGTEYTGKPIPTTYYYHDGPLALTVRALRATHGGTIKVAAVGLGSGSLACSAKAGEKWKFFEIDPVVVKLAKDPSKFRFLSDCGNDIPVVIGDARLTIADEPDKSYDLIILDAFSSDAIPVHLLTREAIGLYMQKLTDKGAIVFHISNRYMRLADVISSIAATHDMVTYNLIKKPKDTIATMDMHSNVAIIARNREDLGVIARTWQPVPVNNDVKPWSDDYSNILSAIYRHYTIADETVSR